MKKLSIILISLMLVLSLAGTSVFAAELSMEPGTYSGSGEGMNGTIEVSVTVSENEITDIEVVLENETDGLTDAVFEKIPQNIVAYQSLAVDGVSGATFASEGLMAAVVNALEKAGADIDFLKNKEIEKEAAKKTEDRSTEVVVIGGGNAGLAAAVSASNNGAEVILLEKMPMLGGNSIRSGGAYNAVDPKRQKKQGIEDSVPRHFYHTYTGGDKKGKIKLIYTLVNNSYNGLRWLESMGMKFKDEVFTVLGALWPRSHAPIAPVGTGYINTLKAQAEKNGVEILLNTKAEKLIKEEGRVVGVKASTEDGSFELKASKGVVLAAGGFAANVEMRKKYNPGLDENTMTTNHPGATGDGIIMAEEIGADLVGMEYIQSLPLGDPETGSLTGWAGMSVENYIFVNKEGKRFVSEAERRDVMTNALINQTDSFMYVVCDAHSMPAGSKNSFNESIEELVEKGKTLKAMTIEGLAEKMNVDPDIFVETIKKYNKAVETGKDEFGKTLFDKKLNKAPFYASPRVPTAHHTMGGVKINSDTQVIDTEGNIIPGLFAAGEVTGGIHGTNRLGGNALPDTIVFGRIAGEVVSK
ncbi:fumarate reductase flavoprotein subunit [Halanaerobium sp. DL-01]|uniref:flavocytochrome c n=1 Tax=Halanaerobium sp. DL-01 TaxID=1653064 RepID=UPI000DF2D973|nr:flavocytochrome c [Halanaerobium sp. DL-01]RCW84230.1 fumarate reductase flavoprotein subunit [Halanaerobium sp. DL-01]